MEMLSRPTSFFSLADRSGLSFEKQMFDSASIRKPTAGCPPRGANKGATHWELRAPISIYFIILMMLLRHKHQPIQFQTA
ncbi:uncharacterized protein BDR25DRAFT_353157 [Lindgomyces ingoldianus]|uniref:Uncharacterized protein n=1 Tax=Lindgomyces ingoldianus TaxID=673940 RepID=A0ACB6R0S1_9PLEO|nr:uncharacterized protein BDR25DRAFT_353157 [Lindgomyces ingoldianus]KAF2472843.1 hypothetical protein BDR25DRAFT_353157 [Lindgomyces ingoldianus]